jgi:hypothetical protein
MSTVQFHIYISFHFHGEVIHSLYMYIIKEMYPIKYQLYFHSCQNANIIVDVSSSRHISLTSQLNITQRNLMSTPEKATFCVSTCQFQQHDQPSCCPGTFPRHYFFLFFFQNEEKEIAQQRRVSHLLFLRKSIYCAGFSGCVHKKIFKASFPRCISMTSLSFISTV